MSPRSRSSVGWFLPNEGCGCEGFVSSDWFAEVSSAPQSNPASQAQCDIPSLPASQPGERSCRIEAQTYAALFRGWPWRFTIVQVD